METIFTEFKKGIKVMGKKFEYKNIRFRFNVSNDITQEFSYLDIDGKRVKKIFDGSGSTRRYG